jgi:hypothetical protein
LPKRDAQGRFVSQSAALARRPSRHFEPDFEPESPAIVRRAARQPVVHHHIVHHVSSPRPPPPTRVRVWTPVVGAEVETSSGGSLLALLAGAFLGGLAVHALTRDS